MVFCNVRDKTLQNCCKLSHNPYFNRWFSAMYFIRCVKKSTKSHNPYFNRWFSAIGITGEYKTDT